MAPRKKVDIGATITSTEDPILSKSKLPLVFISHDTKDAEIAEAFSKLLSSVSAGVLKSFRSSDRKGTQGIEYGVEWFPEIMRKLDEASDIVCLLTQTSVDRPWILYEAGVAKGKLSTTVLGIALGIQLHKANNGPFAQFQNCSDDEESLTKLVLQLVKRIPNSEPDEEIVKDQVKAFKQKLSELLKKQPGPPDKTNELKEDTSIAKLFEEVKIMFQDLPSRIDKRLDPEMMVRRKRRFYPKMIDEVMHMGMVSEEPNLSFLMLISLFRDDFPWIYEIGLDTYRTLKTSKIKSERQKAISSFNRMLETLNHPMMLEFFGRSEDSFFMMNEMRHFLARFADRFYLEDKSKE
ncbi:MAG: hypothetical protein P4L51_18345 [Puia sp.]|nr:hypothetical protein [Puia sp.]